jgi:hypothetical protein
MVELRKRIADESLLRLIGKCLHVGVLDGEGSSEPEVGTAQGSVLSPLLGNVYLHYALDEWFAREVVPRLKHPAKLIRYADDFVIGFGSKADADRVLQVLPQRLGRYGLRLSPEKTRLIHFERPGGDEDGHSNETFDFLGFTWYWGRKGGWSVHVKTRTGRLTRALVAVAEFCRQHRHDSARKQHRGLSTRLQGHFNYFAVTGNGRPVWEAAVLGHSDLAKVAIAEEPACGDAVGSLQQNGARSALATTEVEVALAVASDVRRLRGRAGWWKSPRPVLVRRWKTGMRK